MRGEINNLSQAQAILGLTGAVSPQAVRAAFRAAIKAARPDQPGGDPERFRRLIAAYRLMQATPAALALAAPARRAPTPVAGLTPLQALHGGVFVLGIGGRRLRITAPAGLRTAQHLRLRGAADGGDLYLPVVIRGADGLSCVGDDLYMDWPVAPRRLADGGRIEIDTHAGAQGAWLTPDWPTSRRLRLKGLGLPPLGARPQGHLFVTLIPSEDAPSAAEDLLARFTRVWTPERLAA